ncbi:MAG: hypothetical protein KatS3mg115_1301 [Candidatus Poribacteria bacterium]|nr:MAG: hypothetical protein KatS3mg115_1301 [Candidatus Poribacteria bacterium]
MSHNLDLSDQLAELYTLQEIDEEIADLTERRRRVIQELRTIQQEVEARRADLDRLRDEVKRAQVEQHRLQVELDGLQERIKRYQEQQSNAKDGNEYLALQKQIETSTRQADQLEERLIEAMLRLDALREQLERKEEESKAFLEDRQQVFRERRAVGRELERALEEARTRREAQLVRVNGDLLRRYDHWRSRRKTTFLAVAEKHVAVEQVGRNQQRTTIFTCSGCHMTLPIQLVVEAQKFSRLYECPSCHRVLWVRDPLERIEPEADEAES